MFIQFYYFKAYLFDFWNKKLLDTLESVKRPIVQWVNLNFFNSSVPVQSNNIQSPNLINLSRVSYPKKTGFLKNWIQFKRNQPYLSCGSNFLNSTSRNLITKNSVNLNSQKTSKFTWLVRDLHTWFVTVQLKYFS